MKADIKITKEEVEMILRKHFCIEPDHECFIIFHLGRIDITIEPKEPKKNVQENDLGKHNA